MRNVAVICNNKAEWNTFKNSLLLVLSKKNNRYKATSECVCDIDDNTRFTFLPNSTYHLNVILKSHLYTGVKFHSKMWMCTFDKEISDMIPIDT